MSGQRLLSTLFLISILAIALFVPGRTQAGPPPGRAALQAALPDSVNLDGHAVYLDFWASWCPPCRKSFPWIEEMHRLYGPRGLEVVAVCVDKDPAKGAAFVAEAGTTFRVHYDPEGKLAAVFGLEAMPTSLLFSPQGELLQRHTGFREDDAKELESALRQIYPPDRAADPAVPGETAPERAPAPDMQERGKDSRP